MREGKKEEKNSIYEIDPFQSYSVLPFALAGWALRVA
jgi:hypothetical protein